MSNEGSDYKLASGRSTSEADVEIINFALGPDVVPTKSKSKSKSSKTEPEELSPKSKSSAKASSNSKTSSKVSGDCQGGNCGDNSDKTDKSNKSDSSDFSDDFEHGRFGFG